MKEWFCQAIDEACSSLLRCFGVVAGSLILGFLAGYWIGHGKITSAEQTLAAFLKIPILFLGMGQYLYAYAVTLLAWYLLVHYERRWLRIGAALTTFGAWFIVTYAMVKLTEHDKFFKY